MLLTSWVSRHMVFLVGISVGVLINYALVSMHWLKLRKCLDLEAILEIMKGTDEKFKLFYITM